MTARSSKSDLTPRAADEAFALAALPKRAFGAHKWAVGGVAVVAGGPSYIGAAALTAMAAGRVGAGIVNVAVPRGAMATIAALVPEAAFIPLPEGAIESPSRRVFDAISEKWARSKAAVVGPGLGDDEYADSLLNALFGRRSVRRPSGVGFRHRTDAEPATHDDDQKTLLGGEIPAVIDADGLNWLAKQDEWWPAVQPGALVLTPHVGEMSRLTGLSTEEITADPIGIAVEHAAKWSQIVVLKYGRTIATDGKVLIDGGEAPASLATAGSGDVLAGTIGGLLTQGVAPLDAAGLAIYLGFRAAERVSRTYGTLGLIASDLPPAIAAEIAALEQKRDG